MTGVSPAGSIGDAAVETAEASGGLATERSAMKTKEIAVRCSAAPAALIIYRIPSSEEDGGASRRRYDA